LEFKGGSISGAYTLTGANTKIDATIYKLFDTNVTINGSWIVPVVYPEWFGAIGDGTTIDDTPFAKMADFINNNTNGQTTIKFGHKHYIFTTGIQIKKDIVIDGGGSILEYTVATAEAIYYGLTFAKDNAITQLSCGSVSGSKFSKVITVGNLDGLAVGDYVIIEDTTDYSYSQERAYYHAGDISRIDSISGTTIVLSEPLTQDYSGASVVLHKINPIVCTVSDLEIICHYTTNVTSNGIQLLGAVDSLISNIKSYGSYHLHVGANNCYNVNIEKVYIDCNTPQSYGLNYGVTIGSSKNINIKDCFLKTTRHGYATGNGDVSIPNRYITISGCVVDNYGEGVGCLDFHGNAELVTVTGNIIKAGVDMAASEFVLTNNTIICNERVKSGIDLTTRVRNNSIIRGNKFMMLLESYSSSVDYRNILISAAAYNETDALIIDGNTFDSTIKGDGELHYVSHIDSRTYDNVIKEIIITNNVFDGGNKNISSLLFDATKVKTLSIKDNTCKNALLKLQARLIEKLDIQNNILLSSLVSIYRARKINITGNLMKDSPAAPIDIFSTNAEKANTFINIIGNSIIDCVTASSTSSVYDAPFKIQNANIVKVVDNTVIINDSSNKTLYKFFANDCTVFIFRNKLLSVISVSSPSPSGVTTIIDDDYGATRPTNVQNGYQFFDTSLSPARPIWKAASGWVDATGASV
jgi:hypothetical protein